MNEEQTTLLARAFAEHVISKMNGNPDINALAYTNHFTGYAKSVIGWLNDNQMIDLKQLKNTHVESFNPFRDE